MTRWKLTVEYNGTNFHGWQRQEEALPTIQQSLEEAIYKFCQQKVVTHASGRTDAGVHARGQVVHFDLDYGDRPLDGYDLCKALNAHLKPQSISVIHAEPVSEDFHARFGAKNKLYHYRIVTRPGMLAIDRDLAWHYKKPLDARAMHIAAQALLGHHDFTTFRDTACQAKTPMRTLNKLDVTARDYDGKGGQEIIIAAEAPSFLHHQVRNMVGALIFAGEGKWTAEDMAKALAARDRTKGGVTAPAEGLYLIRVDYI